MKRRKLKMILGIIITLIGLIIVYWNISYSPYKSAFDKDMKQRASNTSSSLEVCTLEEIAQLPEPLIQYCNYIGLENFPKYQVTHTVFKNTKFIMDDTKNQVINMDYDLWSFYDEPYRSAYCQATMFGVPFDGIDYMNDQQEGGMKGILGKTIKIFDVHNQQGYQAGIISWFAESITLNPSILLGSFIAYEVIDDYNVKATISYNGVSCSGIIILNEEGAIVEFYSDDRQVEVIDGVETRIGWRCDYGDYRLEDGLLIAHSVKSVKVYPDREVVYFDSDNFTITRR